jgi:hypothetical protein
MAILPYKGKIFTAIELTWIPILAAPTALGAIAAVTNQNAQIPPVGWIILLTAVLGMWLIAGLYFIRKAGYQKNLRFFINPPGLVVGWADEQYRVDGEDVRATIANCVLKLREEYPRAEEALRGCVVWFREPTWVQPPSGLGVLAHRVAGVQDGQLLVVGWNADLTKSALMHELAHRVLQAQDGDLPDVLSHAKMEQLGVL